jgi:hypothetical protein
MPVSAATIGERALRHLGVAVVPVADRPALTATVQVVTIATNALVWLGVVASDESPLGTNDQALAEAKASAVHDAMVAQGFVSWAITAIPLAVAEEYTLLTALHLSASFGKAGDPSMLPMLEGRVRKAAMIMGAPALAEAAVVSVHQNLAAQGKVRWSLQDIPPAAEDPYMMLAADMIWPDLGVSRVQGDVQAALRALAQIIALPTSGERVQAEYF